MVIIQITDLHIAALGTHANGVDTLANFNQILGRVEADEQADLIVISGDICFQDPVEEVYHHVKSMLDSKPFDYKVIGGNHDDSKMISQIFTGTESLEYFYEYKGMIFLDTVQGSMSTNQWQWLEHKLTSHQDSKVYIFMHHPPRKSMVPHIDDRYAFTQIDEFNDLLDKFSHLSFYIFTGHYHVERSMQYKNCHLFITPSCFLQIADTSPEFIVDHYVPAYRRIVIEDDLFLSTVKYLL
ncbi:MAG: metallophosphoesterase family protein [Saprospiraceae bacterium]|nr:metallophosphoesterase family protein [Saprospiraceae bacterium]MBK8634319.1 metallophosphoesterase family protein [Saprospiraceae bacterium]